MNNSREWELTIDFYRKLVEEGTDLEPLLQLAKRISTVRGTNRIWPYTSHNDLCLSGSSNYSGRITASGLAIHYLGDNMFVLKFWKTLAKPSEYEITECYTSDVFDKALNFIRRLE